MSGTRISTKTLHDGIAEAIGRRNQELLKLQMQISDGRAVRAPSDDPVRAQQAMWFRERSRANAQYERSLQSVTTTLSATENTLNSISDVLSEARDLQVRGANDALEGDARASYAAQVNQEIELMLSLANDQFAGTYTFGGRNSLQAPYIATRDKSGRITGVKVNPHGIDGGLVRQVGPDVSLTINVLGTDLFGKDAAAFQSLIDLRTALEKGTGDQIRAAGNPLAVALNRVVKANSDTGALMGRVEALLARAGRDQVNYEDGRSRAEDLDVAKAMVDFQQDQVALQAALKSGSQILNMSLLDYIS
jgi:flagellar hook-associated protein 3 FlgL